MNERIKELGTLAGLYMESTMPGGFPNEQLIIADRFAELFVIECMRMCEVTEMSFVTHDCDVEASGAITVKQFIAEHFGVEL